MSFSILDETKSQINGLNLYMYCGNDPVNRFDPTGHSWEWSSFWQGVGYLVTGSVATVGSIVCGGWYRYNTPRIQAYKNVGNYSFSWTLSDSTHLARPYQHSTLLQRNIIKYGKMVKESSGIYNFTIGGAYKICWVSYGVGNAGSHPVTWKLVLDIGKQIILHAGS